MAWDCCLFYCKAYQSPLPEISCQHHAFLFYNHFRRCGKTTSSYMGFWGGLAIFAGACIILRAIRLLFVWVDYIIWAIAMIPLICSIYTWYNEGFGHALMVFIVGSIVFGIALYLLFGVGQTTDFEIFGRKCSFKCDNCQYYDLEIVERDENKVVIECVRCKHRITIQRVNI